MESEQEKMQFLGLFGLFKESYKIMLSWRKIFSQITLTLILPLSFIFLIHIEVTDVLFGKILHHSEDMTEAQFGTPQHQKLLETISTEWATFFLFELVYFVFILIFSLLSTSAVVYTVANIYTGREVTFNKVMSVVPKVWQRLMVTFLYTLVAGFVYNVMAVVVIIIWALTIGVRNGGIAIFVVIGILYLAGLLYLTVIWQLASVVTVLEDSYGFEAMTKSKELIKGKMGLSIIITLNFNVSFFVIRFLFAMVVVNGSKLFELGSMNRIAHGILCFFLLSHLVLLMLVIQTVLYFVSKSYHHQNIDKSALSDHLEVYQGEYEPLKAKDVQLDYHV